MVSDVSDKHHGIPFVKVERSGPALFPVVITTGMPILMTGNEAFVIGFFFFFLIPSKKVKK